MYLLDTNVVSEMRRPRPHGAVAAWLKANANGSLRVAAVTLGELQAGVEITREQNPAKAIELEQWIERVAATFNIVAMDGGVFRHWARIQHKRSYTIAQDAIIAATAEVHGLTVATRNVRDFEKLGVRTFDPFTYKGE